MTFEQHIQRTLNDRYLGQVVSSKDGKRTFLVKEVDLDMWGTDPTFTLRGFGRHRLVHLHQQMPEIVDAI